mgnify:CR=1 FL=1
MAASVVKKKILVVVSDAGGAEIISAFIVANRKKFNFYCFLNGPAQKIFKRKKIKFIALAQSQNAAEVLSAHSQAKLLLTGSSWSTDLELQFIKAARTIGLRTATYLDHWVNYRERFGYPRRDWIKNLPDEIWVGDKRAYLLAKKYFQTRSGVFLQPNRYFEEIKKKYARSPKERSSDLLIVTEPLSEAINSLGQQLPVKVTETLWLERILSFLAQHGFKKKIFLRLHPSERPDKYDFIVEKFKKILPIKKTNGDIIRDLKKVGTVFGVTSMALVAAELCRKQVFSIVMDKNLLSFVPQRSRIHRVTNLQKSGKIIRKLASARHGT